jgi:hypothetical protein
LAAKLATVGSGGERQTTFKLADKEFAFRPEAYVLTPNDTECVISNLTLYGDYKMNYPLDSAQLFIDGLALVVNNTKEFDLQGFVVASTLGQVDSPPQPIYVSVCKSPQLAMVHPLSQRNLDHIEYLYDKGQYGGEHNITVGEWNKMMTYDKCHVCVPEFSIVDSFGAV